MPLAVVKYLLLAATHQELAVRPGFRKERLYPLFEDGFLPGFERFLVNRLKNLEHIWGKFL